jgi:hypothetical protein
MYICIHTYIYIYIYIYIPCTDILVVFIGLQPPNSTLIKQYRPLVLIGINLSNPGRPMGVM